MIKYVTAEEMDSGMKDTFTGDDAGSFKKIELWKPGNHWLMTGDGQDLMKHDPVVIKKYSDMIYGMGQLQVPHGLKLGVIGAGVFYLQTMLMMTRWGQMDTYEIIPGLKEWNIKRQPDNVMKDWNWIIGDWNKTITGKYDILIHDADESVVDKDLLNNHVVSGGVVLIFEQDGSNR